LDKYSLTYRSTLDSSEHFLDDLEHLLVDHRIEKEIAHNICLVLSEAFNNALLHGNKCNPDKTISVFLHVNDSGLSADIVDQGEGGVDKVRDRKSYGLLAEHGRGIDLMYHLATSTQFTSEEDGGLKVSIFFRRSSDREEVG
jgi:serine/threonine-protein kinase RsbW